MKAPESGNKIKALVPAYKRERMLAASAAFSSRWISFWEEQFQK